MNKNDSEIMAGILEKQMSYTQIEDPHKAEIIIFNTCAVRGNAENRAFARMREFDALRKKRKKDQLLVLAGCVPQYEKDDIKDRAPFIDYFIGPNSLDSLKDLLDGHFDEQVLRLNENRDLQVAYDLTKRSREDQAWISVMYGCDNFCSYCIVPYTRGREVSRPREDILKEIAYLNKACKRVVLLGQNVNSYGKNLYENYDFADLLSDVHELPNLEWLSFLTSHPKDISEKLIRTLSRLPKCDKEIHFPLQAGDNDVLKAMNRGYTVEKYKSIVDMIRSYIPDARISTDLIVGFPGETEEQFQNTIRAVKEIGFFRINTAAYSPRKGTKAAEMESQLDEKTKHRRLLELQQVVDEVALIKKK